MRRLEGCLPELPGIQVPLKSPSGQSHSAGTSASKGKGRFSLAQGLDLACTVERLRVSDGNGYECPRCSRAGAGMGGNTSDSGTEGESSDEDDADAGASARGKEAGGSSPVHAVVHRNGSRRFVLLSLPPVLIMHAQRFRLQAMGAMARYVKDDKSVSFPGRIDMRPWLLASSSSSASASSSEDVDVDVDASGGAGGPR